MTGFDYFNQFEWNGFFFFHFFFFHFFSFFFFMFSVLTWLYFVSLLEIWCLLYCGIKFIFRNRHVVLISACQWNRSQENKKLVSVMCFTDVGYSRYSLTLWHCLLFSSSSSRVSVYVLFLPAFSFIITMCFSSTLNTVAVTYLPSPFIYFRSFVFLFLFGWLVSFLLFECVSLDSLCVLLLRWPWVLKSSN